MKFKFIGDVDGEVPSYDGTMIKKGSIVDLDGRLAEKATANPDYELAKKAPAKKPTKKDAAE